MRANSATHLEHVLRLDLIRGSRGVLHLLAVREEVVHVLILKRDAAKLETSSVLWGKVEAQGFTGSSYCTCGDYSGIAIS